MKIKTDSLNFSVGPVKISDEISEIGALPVPYFRTEEFSLLMKENERLFKKFIFAPDNSRAVFLTGSGTAGMEAAVISLFDENDRLIIVNGGGFGQRFCDICTVHGIPFDEIRPAFGYGITESDLKKINPENYTGFLVNMHETSVGVLYDMELIGSFCKKHGLLLVTDAISSFIADTINMEKLGINALITGSQKALALPPGVSAVALDGTALEKIPKIKRKSFYLDLGEALKNGERGQTPFTPAVGTLIQLNFRLNQIEKDGFSNEQNKIRRICEDFRRKITALPFDFVSHSPSFAVTPLSPKGNVSAYFIFETLKDEYNITVCPNGGEFKDKIFRVGHLGNLTEKDNDRLISALKDMEKRGLLL